MNHLKVITLSNGKRVANFSSPHDFIFTDGTILPAVSNEESERLKVIFLEMTQENGDVELAFDLSDDVLEEMGVWELYYHGKDVDVVFVPQPMMIALKDRDYPIKNSPFRSIRIEDRIKKLVSIEKQCI